MNAQKNDTIIEIQEVEIKSSPIDNSMYLFSLVVDSMLIDRNKESSLSEIIAQHTHLFVKSSGRSSMSTVSIRGTSSAQMKLVWNGLELNNPMTSQADFFKIPAYFFDRLSILPGSSAVLLEDNAPGGIITIEDKPPSSAKKYVEFLQTFGSFNSLTSAATVGINDTNFRANIRFFNEQSENIFEFENTAVPDNRIQEQRDASYRKQGIMASLSYNNEKTGRLTLKSWLLNSNRDIPPIMSYEGLGREENQIDKDQNVLLHWKKNIERFTSSLTAGFSQAEIKYFLANKTPSSWFVNYETRNIAQTTQVKYKLDFDINKTTVLTGGVEGQYENAKMKDQINDYSYKANRLHSQVHFTVLKSFVGKMNTYAVIRKSFYNDYNPITYAVGGKLRPFKNDQISFNTSFSRNYHVPALNDLHWIPGGNPELEPEKGVNGELGADVNLILNRFFQMNPSITFFKGKIKNRIIWKPSDFGFWSPVNVQEVFIHGLENDLRLKMTFNKQFYAALHAGYSYTRSFEIVQNEKIQLIYIPIHKGKAFADICWRKFTFNYLMSYFGKRNTTMENTLSQHALPDYVLHFSAIHYDMVLKRMQVQMGVKVDNIFNHSYQTVLWRAMPGRAYSITLKINYQ